MREARIASQSLDLDESCDPAIVDEAARTLERGGLVLLRTVVGYGIVGTSDDAIAAMYELKGRPLTNPLIVVGNIDLFDALTKPVEKTARDWLDRIVTRTTLAVVNDIDTESSLFRNMSDVAKSQATRDGSVAIFLNTGWLPEQLAKRMAEKGRVLFGTSANATGQGNSQCFEEVPDAIRRAADFSFDQGEVFYRTLDKLATTIVDLRTMTISRIGVSAAMLMQDLRKLHVQMSHSANTN
ncbi:Sua5/YciO/YrdC/YwlC family protein [Sphingopyxis sp. SE2]|uniref:L-threonylcarbamoyladenylate synthase n=1 Tax=Sphingopyxis sp. SE2 TaxID=1586240 RepID=UPI0028C30A58|nr:Sua5/YciO/YrdC/YwlC family protein [Sphingopyxis sp. SE2]MDT7531078.1 Sua5/YciO/YrdC/YwlC family protein [Sphingopyxis sp. SE2]